MIVAITHLKLKHIGKLPGFMKHTNKSKAASENASGNIGVQVRSEGILVHRTLTVWEDQESLMNFVTSKPHVDAMKATRNLASETVSDHWECEEMTSWKEALGRIGIAD